MHRDLRRSDSPSLYCIEVATENWERMVRWYREVLGLRVLVRVMDDGYALVEAGDTRIALLSRPAGGEASRRISLAFEVGDVPKVWPRLEAAGSVISHPKRDEEGLREANTTDPDGNWIRLFSWPKRR